MKPTTMNWVEEELAILHESGLYRAIRRIDGPPAPFVKIDGKRVMLLCSNNYLGLATHPHVVDAAVRATRDYGSSASASRLTAGNHSLYDKLEDELATFEQRESALVFSSGYLANLAILTTLAGSGDIIFSDSLNHASIVDGCRLSRARTLIFEHGNPADLADKIRTAGSFRRGLIVVEGVYSLDGDFAPLEEFVEVARVHNLIMVVDEAHGTGVHGVSGRGACERAGVSQQVDIIMGTFGKALGSVGAFVACRNEVRELLVNRARPLIYSTGLPPGALAAASAALDIVRAEPARREILMEGAIRLRDELAHMGYNVPWAESQIVPVIVGDNERTVELSEKLLRMGLFVQAIRPPSVPPGTARLRLTPMATHSDSDIDRAIDTFESAGRTLGII